MEKKLPKVFANKIDKNLENNDNYFYSANSETSQEDIRESKEQSFIVHGENVQQKIQSIFNSPRYEFTVISSPVLFSYVQSCFVKSVITLLKFFDR